MFSFFITFDYETGKNTRGKRYVKILARSELQITKKQKQKKQKYFQNGTQILLYSFLAE